MQEELAFNITEVCIYRQQVDMFCQLSGVCLSCVASNQSMTSVNLHNTYCQNLTHLPPHPPAPPRLSSGFALSSDSSSCPAALREVDEDEEEDRKMRREKRLPSSSHLLASPPSVDLHVRYCASVSHVYCPSRRHITQQIFLIKEAKGDRCWEGREKVPESSAWRGEPAAESGDVFSPLKDVSLL